MVTDGRWMIHDQAPGARGQGPDTRDKDQRPGRTRDQGSGTRDHGQGTRDQDQGSKQSSKQAIKQASKQASMHACMQASIPAIAKLETEGYFKICINKM